MAEQTGLVVSLRAEFQTLISNGQSSGRLWLYSNYHCNLSCRYCLTASSPSSPIRGLSPEQMVDAVTQAKEFGFTSVGVTGGEPFLMSWMPDVLRQIAETLPVIVLTNGTLLTRERVRAGLLSCRGLPVQIQVSVDDIRASVHDANRGVGSFNRAIAGIPWMIEQGLSVRISSTREFTSAEDRVQHDDEMGRWMTNLGLDTADHVGRTMVHRGQATVNGMGVQVSTEQLPADLTLTKMGAFYSPFAPTFVGQQLQTDMLLSRTILPLSIPLRQLISCLRDRDPNAVSASEAEGFV